MATKKKLQAGEKYRAILSFFGAAGAFVEAGSEYRGDSEIVRLHPMHFALSADGQEGIDRATHALQRDMDEARLNREKMWYGTQQPEPEAPRRAIAVKAFTHGDASVEIGDIFPSDALIVAQVNHAFVIAQD